MASMELISLPTIVEQIRQLCTQLRTGTVFLVSDQNRMVQVHLDRGEIAFLMHRNRRGQEALQVIAGMRQARLRFDEADATRTERTTCRPATCWSISTWWPRTPPRRTKLPPLRSPAARCQRRM